MEKSWQDVLDTFHYGIYLITINTDSGYNGMIASWVSQCSHEPPLVAIAIRNNRLSCEQIRETGGFTINVLPREFMNSIQRFKIPDWKRKFDDLDYTITTGGRPVLSTAIGYLDCTVEHVVETGDHTLFIAGVRSGELRKHGDSLCTEQYAGVYRGER